jgi:hypothetical protein
MYTVHEFNHLNGRKTETKEEKMSGKYEKRSHSTTNIPLPT